MEHYYNINNFWVNTARSENKITFKKPLGIFSAIQLYKLFPFALHRIRYTKAIRQYSDDPILSSLIYSIITFNKWMLDKFVDNINIGDHHTFLHYLIFIYNTQKIKRMASMKYIFDKIVPSYDAMSLHEIIISIIIPCLVTGNIKLIKVLIRDSAVFNSTISTFVDMFNSHMSNMHISLNIDIYRYSMDNIYHTIRDQNNLFSLFQLAATHVRSIKFLLEIDVDLKSLWQLTCLFGTKKTIKYMIDHISNIDTNLSIITLDIEAPFDMLIKPPKFELTYKEILYMNPKTKFKAVDPSSFVLSWSLSHKDDEQIKQNLKHFKPSLYDIISLFMDVDRLSIFQYLDKLGLIDWLQEINITSPLLHPDNKNNRLYYGVTLGELLFYLFYADYTLFFAFLDDSSKFQDPEYTVRVDYLLQYININNVYAYFGIPDAVDINLIKHIDYNYLSLVLPDIKPNAGKPKVIKRDGMICFRNMSQMDRLKILTGDKKSILFYKIKSYIPL